MEVESHDGSTDRQALPLESALSSARNRCAKAVLGVNGKPRLMSLKCVEPTSSSRRIRGIPRREHVAGNGPAGQNCPCPGLKRTL